MAQLIIGIIILVAVLLVLVVLAQNSKGGGLSGQFGTAGASQLMGAKRTSDFLEKLTWGLAIFILAFSLMANVIIKPDQATYTSPSIEPSAAQGVEQLQQKQPGDSATGTPSQGTPAQELPAAKDSAKQGG